MEKLSSLKNKIKITENTDTGIVRKNNEDTIGSDHDLGLLILADGMGGYNAGEVASELAVKTITNLVSEASRRENRNEIDSQTGFMRQTIFLRDSVARANKIIYQTANTKKHCEGMGTTIVAVMFCDNKISITHVGDSRVYRYRNEKLEQLTSDHSLLQELIDRGVYSNKDAEHATNKNYVTRALGVEKNVEIAIQENKVLPGDIYLLCSDGLSDMLDDNFISITINNLYDDINSICHNLITSANEAGGKDNISVQLAHIEEEFPVKTNLIEKIKNKIFRNN